MAIQGYKSPLESKDLWSLNKLDRSEGIVSKLLNEWEVEKARIQRYRSHHTVQSVLQNKPQKSIYSACGIRV